MNKLNFNSINNNFNNLGEINNNSVKSLRIDFEVKKELNFNVNEDKQRQCYKQLKCFWPKCRYRAKEFCHFNNHISLHLEKRKFVCDKCNKQFKYQSNLISHQNSIHSTDKPFICSINNCNKKFQTKKGFLYHKSYFHSTDKAFVCPQSDCNKRYKTKKHLQYLELRPSSVNNFGCDKCDKRFKTNSELRNHKNRNHIGIKRHKCLHNNCDKTFFNLSELKSHSIFKHSTERPYKCDFHQCQLSYKTRSTLNTHKTNVHQLILNCYSIDLIQVHCKEKLAKISHKIPPDLSP